jgi:anti-anti-sigma factor
VTDLTVSRSDDGDRSTLALTGELDIDSVADLREPAEERLGSGECSALTLDLAGLTFIDSSGLGLLIELRRLALGSGASFHVVNVPSGPARVIGIAGLTETFGLPAPDGGPAGS